LGKSDWGAKKPMERESRFALFAGGCGFYWNVSRHGCSNVKQMNFAVFRSGELVWCEETEDMVLVGDAKREKETRDPSQQLVRFRNLHLSSSVSTPMHNKTENQVPLEKKRLHKSSLFLGFGGKKLEEARV